MNCSCEKKKTDIFVVLYKLFNRFKGITGILLNNNRDKKITKKFVQK